MARDEGYRDLKLNVLRLCPVPRFDDGLCLLVVSAGVGFAGDIGEFDNGSLGEPVEIWLARRRNKLGTEPLAGGR